MLPRSDSIPSIAMNGALKFLLLWICLLINSQAHDVLYVSQEDSANATCSLEGIMLCPCYSFNQIDPAFIWDQDSVNLLFLPGMHLITDFYAMNVSYFTLSPWNETMQIECLPSAQVVFDRVYNLNISSIEFISCTIEVLYYNDYSSLQATTGTMFITFCSFQNSSITAIATHTSIIACDFSSSYNGAITSRHYFGVARMNISNTLFIENSRQIDFYNRGGAVVISSVALELYNCHFIRNAAQSGGAIYGENSSIIVYDSSFVENSAINGDGGAFLLYRSSLQMYHTHLVNNSAQYSGGAILTSGIFEAANFGLVLGNVTFTSNTAESDGGAIYCKGIKDGLKLSVAIDTGESSLNSARRNGGYAYLYRCYVETDNGFKLTRNRAREGGAIYACESVIDFSVEYPIVPVYLHISNNTAEISGGGLYMDRSQISVSLYRQFRWPTVLILNQNVVTSSRGKGGAIFVSDSNCDHQCFLTYRNDALVLSDNFTRFSFTNNRAQEGSLLYGGLLDRCNPGFPSLLPVIQVFQSISNLEHRALHITSEAVKVCPCCNSRPNCVYEEISFAKMRGEGVGLKVCALDQAGNLVESIITASYLDPLAAQLQLGEVSQQVSSTQCTDLNYHIFAGESTETATLILEPSDNPCRGSQISVMMVHLTILPCSRGFELSENMCVCDRRLKEQFNVTTCNIDTKTIERKGSIWLRYDEHNLRVVSNCPLDYCQVTESYINLSSPDNQCANSRGGILCGECGGNMSAILGGSKCKHCTASYHYVWLTLVFAVAGMALVALLLLCNITISAGTLNGLILYANIVSTSGMTSLHNCSISPLLSVFIAWINLDLGIETCFFSGMNAYQKTWLQFAFPLYIWLLVGAIIVTSYYSSKAMKIFGSSNIAILATLFLLSYSKLLKTIATALSFTQVWRGAANNVTDRLVPYKVWTYDGNLEYLQGQHTVLFIVAFLVLVLLFLPYTLMILFGQYVRAMPVKRRWPCLRWIRSTAFVSVMDAYHAPYTKKHRYWTGLTLLARCALFLVFATNSSEDLLLMNAFSITVAVIGILVLKSRLTRVYRKTYLEVLEMAFLVNLVITSAVMYYLQGKGNQFETQCKTVTSSLSISFVVFLGILSYHCYLQLAKTRCYEMIRGKFLARANLVKSECLLVLVNTSVMSSKSPTTTTVGLRETLLDSCTSDM